MSRRVQVVVADPLAAQLDELADLAGEPMSTVAAHLVRDGLSNAASEVQVRRSTTSSSSTKQRSTDRAPWLEPYGGDRAWRQDMWGSIVALYGRYPRLLEPLNDGWWSDEAHTEVLCALAVWRSRLDDVGTDPREEIVFHNQLAEYSRILREGGAGVARAWIPGPPPPEWSV